jgi:hypothetical protein
MKDVHLETIPVPKGCIYYFAIVFNFRMELLNLKIRKENNPLD